MAAPMAFRNKDEALEELVTSEERYVRALKTFRNGFIQEIRHRDTEDRRKLYYGHKAVSVAWELIHILHAHNHQLLKSLQVAGNDVEAVARAFLSFAAAEKAYSVYCANHAEALLGLDKVLGPTLIKYTKDHPVAGGLTVGRYLNLPFERFPQYVEFLQAVRALTATAARAWDSEDYDMPAAASSSSSSSTSATLEAALQAMEEGLRCVTVATNEFARQNELVNLQAQFMGYVDLYAPDRCLVKEGMLTKIYIDGSKRKPQERYTHLLSDALLYSNTLVGPYKYKLAKIHGLHLVAAAVPVAEDPTMFDLTKAEGEGDTIRFQAPDKATAIEWMDAINAHTTAQKTKASPQNAAVSKAAATEPRQARVNALSFLKKHGAALEGLSGRSKTIAYGLKADLTYCEYLKVFARVVGVTLDELSRGIGAVGGKRGSVENGDAERANGLFETKTKTFNQLTEGTVNRVKAAHAGKPLQSPEIAVFLKVLPVLESLSQALVERLEERLTAHSQTGAEFCIGDIYLDMSALFVAYQSYASVMDEAESVLGNPALVELAESLSDELSPLTIQQHLTAPVEAAQRMAIQMKAVLEMTPEEHPDHQALELATLMMEQTATGMLSNQQDTKDYWKLVSIREAIGSMEFNSNSPLETLVTADRKLILEGNLLKACRSKDKAYMFWLFTDALLYATQLATSHLYQLNRWMALTEMNVQASVQEATGLDILTAEKSFTVFAKDAAERDMWLERISEAVNQAKEAAGMSTDPASLQVAPILVQTSDSKDCALCHTGFTLFMRKHHCLSCGNVVCDKCSPSRMILPNIHKTERQRVCNACVAGETHHIRAANTATGEFGIHPALAPVEQSPKAAALAEEEEHEEVVEEENEAPQRMAPLLFSPGAGNAAPVPSWLTSPQHSISPGGLVAPTAKTSPRAAAAAAAAEPVYAPVMVDGWTGSQAYESEPEDNNANPFGAEGERLAMPASVPAAAEAEVEEEDVMEEETPAVKGEAEAPLPVMVAVETIVALVVEPAPAPVASFAFEPEVETEAVENVAAAEEKVVAAPAPVAPIVVAPVEEVAAPAVESTPFDFSEQATEIEPVEEVVVMPPAPEPVVFETAAPSFETAPFEVPQHVAPFFEAAPVELSAPVVQAAAPFFEAASFEVPEPVPQAAVPAFDTFNAPAPLPLSPMSRKLSLSASAGVAPVVAAVEEKAEAAAVVMAPPAPEAVAAVEFNDPFDI